MKLDSINPFDITKAVDFNDEQIKQYFVDVPQGGFAAMANPRSPMPMLIMGGKGSGKTHLMRNFSYPLQKVRHGNDHAGIKDEGYLGVYLRCGGLNAMRFRGKGQTEEAWDAVFAYYMELWLGQLVIACAADFLAISGADPVLESSIARECISLLDHTHDVHPTRLAEVGAYFHQLQRSLDSAINNSALTRELDVVIEATSGRISFGLPKLLNQKVEDFAETQFLYLIDEYENLMERQQKYVNTLLREKEPPCSFRIGGRTYGFKTYKTYSDEEEIRKGSEYEVLLLDQKMRDLPSADYRIFARELCFRRLEKAGFVSALHDEKTKAEFLEKAFEVITAGPFNEIETRFVVDKWKSSERPYIEKLRQKLFDGMRVGKTPDVGSSSDIEAILDKLSVSNYPLLEKMNIYLFYRGWRSAASLQVLAEHIATEACALLNTGEAGKYSRQLEKRKGDMLAQMYRECGGKQQYLGIDTFIDMSQGLPRNLLVVLKSIYNWSTFRGEGPFVKGQISATSQREGVREAAEWFFDDARSPGDDGSSIRASIRRLATLFREIRYSDKPSEKALCTFSADMPRASEEAQRIVSLAEKWSLLLRVTEGQKDKNTFRIDEKFFINPMLAPKWDLPTARGGALALQPNEVNAIFDEGHSELFEALQYSRVSAMTAPLFGLKPSDSSVEDHGQTNLEWDSADD